MIQDGKKACDNTGHFLWLTDILSQKLHPFYIQMDYGQVRYFSLFTLQNIQECSENAINVIS